MLHAADGTVEWTETCSGGGEERVKLREVQQSKNVKEKLLRSGSREEEGRSMSC
jgi:hypothetical protein